MFDFKSLLGGVISHRKALSILVHHLEKSVGHDIHKFQMTFDALAKKVDYLVYYPDQNNYPEKYKATELHPAGTHLYSQNDGEKFVNVILSTLEDTMEIPKGSTIDKAVLIWHLKEPIQVYLFYSIDNVKQQPIKTTIQ